MAQTATLGARVRDEGVRTLLGSVRDHPAEVAMSPDARSGRIHLDEMTFAHDALNRRIGEVLRNIDHETNQATRPTHQAANAKVNADRCDPPNGGSPRACYWRRCRPCQDRSGLRARGPLALSTARSSRRSARSPSSRGRERQGVESTPPPGLPASAPRPAPAGSGRIRS